MSTKLTPIDIQQQQFRRVWRGYDTRDTHQYLEVIAQQTADLIRENTELKADARRSQQQLEELKSREEALKDAMLTAQRALDDLREHAQKEAELLINEAELRAEKILHNANKQVTRMQDEVTDLRRQRARFLEEVRGVVNTHARLLDVHAADARESAAEASVTVLERLRPPAPPSVEDVANLL